MKKLLDYMGRKTVQLFKLSLFVFCFPDGSVGKDSASNSGVTGDKGLIPGSVRSLGGGHGHPLQYSRLESPMDGGLWWATVHGVT